MKKKFRVRVPSILQMEALECGAASLAMVLAYHGKWVPLPQVRDQLGVSRDGATTKSILDGAQHYGMEATSSRVFASKLRQEAELPCIVHWDKRHFVVVTGYDEKHVYINNPASGPQKYRNDDFCKHFSNLVIRCKPTAEFVADGKPASILDFVGKRLNGARSVITYIVIAGLMGAALSSVVPKVSQAFIDDVLASSAQQLAPALLAVLAIAAVLQLVLDTAQSSYLTAANGRFDMESSENFVTKLLRLPMRFYSQRTAGDLLLRQSSNSRVSNTLIETVAPLAVCAISLVVYLAMMLSISIPLALVGVVTTLLNLAVGGYISKKRVEIFRTMARDCGNLSGLTSGIVGMIETVKASGHEQDYYAMWTGKQANVASGQAKVSLINCYLGSIPNLLLALANALVILLGVVLILDGQLTAGALVAMQSLVSLFTTPAQSLIQSGQVIQEMRTDMERIDDVMDYADDEVFTRASEHPINDCIHGTICLNHVTFGYSKQIDPLLEDFDMQLEPGQRVALVGGSGSGKSTVAKLMAGLYQPWSGEILYDGASMFAYDRRAFTSSIAMVDQDIVMFKGTFESAIRFGNADATHADVERAARDAQIYPAIMARGGFECTVDDEGRGLSGGQRQQMEIARALAGNPSVLIFDEATSALDAQTESLVMDAVKARGMGLVIIAHRLSTVRDADEIIVLERGHVVERGTHDELMALQGTYHQLVSAC